MTTDNPLLKHLLTRRSTKLTALKAPGPTKDQLDLIFTSATRVPDHKRTLPWRFVVFEGEARARFGALLADLVTRESAEAPSPMRIENERQRPMRAPVVVAIIFRHTPTPGAPELEQLMSCGAAGMNLVHAANAMGFGTNWVTEWPAFSPGVRAALGLAENERVAGFVYIGTPGERQEERERPAIADVVTHWQG